MGNEAPKSRLRIEPTELWRDTSCPMRVVWYSPDPNGKTDELVAVYSDGRVVKGPSYTTEDDAWRAAAAPYFRMDRS